MVRRYSSFKAFVLLYSFALSGVFISSNFAQNAAELPPELMMGTPDVGVAAPPEAVGISSPPDTSNASQPVGPQPVSGGPETVDLSQEKVGAQGNWMKKRDWLMKTNEANNELQELVLNISGIRKTYNEKYRGIDEILDEFYKQLGHEQGKLQEIFDGAIRYLDKKKKKTVTALSTQSSEEEDKDKNLQVKIELIEQQINTLKGSLEQLKLNMKSIEDLDRSVMERMKKVDEQINVANDEAANAQKITDHLWYIIDDKKARTYYYEIKGSSLEKVKVIDAYLKGDLLTDFDVVIDTIKTHITKTQEEIKALEDKGIIIKDRARRVEELKLKDLQDAELKRKEAELAQQKAAAERAHKAKQPTTWYGKIYRSVTDFFSTMVTACSDFFSSLYQKAFGSKKPVSGIKSVLKKSEPTPTGTTASGSTTQTATTSTLPTTLPATLPTASPQILPQVLPQAPTATQQPLQMPTT